MDYLAEMDQVTIFISLDQALFVLTSNQWCPQCGRPSMLFRHWNCRTECIGCSGSDPAEENDGADIVLPVYGSG